jgi:hypothetical protein
MEQGHILDERAATSAYVDIDFQINSLFVTGMC